MEDDYGFCRICLKIKSETFSIFRLYRNEFLPNIIFNISGVNVEQGKEPKAAICKQCALAVLVAYKIILRCQESEEYLTSQLRETIQYKRVEQYQQVNEKNEKKESVDVAFEMERINFEEGAIDLDMGSDLEPDLDPDPDPVSDPDVHHESHSEFKEDLEDGLTNEEHFNDDDFFIEINEQLCNIEPIDEQDEDLKCLEMATSKESLDCDNALNSKKLKRKVTSLNKLFCDLCDFSTRLAREFIIHRKDVHNLNDKNIYVCKLCPARFSNRKKHFQHLEAEHKIIPEEKRYVCSICGKTYCRSSHLSLHKKECHTPKLFQCDYEGCKQSFSRRFTLKRHFQAVHSTTAVYHCETCNKSFKVYDNWKYHNDVVHKNHLVYCPKCGFGFRQKDKLDEHLANQLCKKAIIPCDYCHRKFTTSGGLITHMRNIHRF